MTTIAVPTLPYRLASAVFWKGLPHTSPIASLPRFYLILVIIVAALLYGSVVYAQDASNSGNLTGAGQSVTLDLDTFGAAVVQVTGTWTGALEFEATVDGTNFDADLSGHAPGSATLTTATGANGVFEMPVSGYVRMQVRASALSSGTAVVSIRASKGPSTGPIVAVHTGLTDTQLRATPVPISGSVTVSGTVTVNDPSFTDATGTTVPANAAFVAGTDGTNTRALKTDSGGELQIDVLTLPAITVGDPSYTDATGTTVPANAAFVAGTDGTNTRALKVDSDGNLQIECLAGCGGAAAFEDNDAFTPGTTSVAIIAAEVDDTGTSAVSENSAGAPRMSTRREMYQQIRDAAGNERGANVTAANALKVDGSAVTQPVSGTVSITGSVDVSGSSVVDANIESVTGTVGGAHGATPNVLMVGASDGTNLRLIKTDTSGEVLIQELPTPAAIAFNTDPGSITKIQTFPMYYDGLDWDPWMGNIESANLTQVNGQTLAAGNGSTTTGTLRVTVSNDSTGVLANVATIGTSVTPGTAATNLGKAEDTAHTSADVGVMGLAVRKESTTQLTSAADEYSPTTVDAFGATRVTLQHVNQLNCTISSTATTSTVITGCTAPGAGNSIYISAISWYSSIISTTTNFMTIQSGTGGNCGASVDVLYRGFAQVAFSGREMTFPVPIKVPANEEVCLLHPGAGTRLVTITGHIGPG